MPVSDIITKLQNFHCRSCEKSGSDMIHIRKWRFIHFSHRYILFSPAMLFVHYTSLMWATKVNHEYIWNGVQQWIIVHVYNNELFTSLSIAKKNLPWPISGHRNDLPCYYTLPPFYAVWWTRQHMQRIHPCTVTDQWVSHYQPSLSFPILHSRNLEILYIKLEFWND